jgi:hypothetical protein
LSTTEDTSTAGGGGGHVTGATSVAELRLPSHVLSSLHVHALHPDAWRGGSYIG